MTTLASSVPDILSDEHDLDPQPAPSGRPCTAASLALPAGT